MVSLLLSVTFACGLVIAVAHVVNRPFVAPVYDVVANLVAFGCAVAASAMLGHRTPALLSTGAALCWLVLARRTYRARRPSGRRRREDEQRPSFHRLDDQPVDVAGAIADRCGD